MRARLDVSVVDYDDSYTRQIDELLDLTPDERIELMLKRKAFNLELREAVSR